MSIYQALYVIVSLLAFAVGWLGGGHVERRAVIAVMITFIASVLVQDFESGRIRWAVIVVDAALVAYLLREAMIRDRWWLLVAGAGGILNMWAHAAMFLDPDLSLRTNVATRWLIGFMMIVALAMGPLERRWAGERSVFMTWLRG